MDFEEKESGLVVPKQLPEKPKREYGPIEFTDECKRNLAAKHFQELWLLVTRGSGIVLHDEVKQSQECRQRLIRALAVELLGEDVEFWEYT